MSEDDDLQADIERIAKLRGRSVPQPQAGDRRIGSGALRQLFISCGDPRLEQIVFDELPALSREFIRESPVFISPVIWASMLERYTEAEVIDLAKQYTPERGREVVNQRFGPEHPQANADAFTAPRPARNKKLARDSERVRIVTRRLDPWPTR